MKQFILQLPDDTHKDIKTYAANSGITMQEYINNLITQSLTELKSQTYILRDYNNNDAD